MTLAEKIAKDMTEAMKARQEQRLGTLRMMKATLKNKEVEKRAPLDDSETIAVLGTMIKQRHESIEQFTKGNRPELAAQEAAEIALIETYMPKSAGEAEVLAAVKATIAEMGAPTMKDMGTVMKNTMARFAGQRVDGRLVSDTVKRELSAR